MADSGLMQRLTAVSNTADLYTALIALARTHGLELTVAELEKIARANRQAWLERWLLL